jgi:mercuric ion transport protein
MAPRLPNDGSQGRLALLTGGLAAVLASTCCLGPLILLSLGISGAWIGNLTLLEPYRPIFLGVALVAWFLAGRRLYLPSARCAPGQLCARADVRTVYRMLFWLVAALIVVALAFPYVAPVFY